MKGFNSIGDMSRFAQLRRANNQLKTRLNTLTNEAATGLKSDVTAATGGNLGRLAQVQSRLNLLNSYTVNASVAQTELDSLQSALTTINKIGATRGPDLHLAQTLSEESALAVRSTQAKSDFETVVRMLNIQVAGKFVLSGTNVTTPPLADPEDMLAQIRVQVAGLTDAADFATAIDDWFANDFVSNAYSGNTDATTSGVSPDATVKQSLTAIDPTFRTMLSGLAMAALAGDSSLGLDRGTQATLMGEAGKHVTAATRGVTALQAQVGMQQSLIAEAATRNSAEVTALSIARSDILAADPYETATALQLADVNLKNLYAVTARVSRLSLTDYL